MGMSKESKRKLKSVESMIYAGVMDEKSYRNLMKETNGRDFDTSMVMFNAYATAHTNYDNFLEKKVIQEKKYQMLSLSNGSEGQLEDMITARMNVLHKDQEFMEGYLAPAVREKTIEREKQLKAIDRAKVNKDRAKAIGFSFEGIKKSMGLSR